MKHCYLFLLGVVVLWCKILNATSADLNFAPLPFKYGSDQVVFVDFKSATYQLLFNAIDKKTYYKAFINFTSTLPGLPAFDVVQDPEKISIDGVPTTQELIVTPGKETKLRIVKQTILPGDHQLIIEGQIDDPLIRYNNDRLYAGFWFDDLEDRSYLEKYLPANFEYDQFQIDFLFSIKSEHNPGYRLYTNGIISNNTPNGPEVIKVSYPSYFTASSLYFHIVPVNHFQEESFNFTSIDGRNIPVVIYGDGAKVNLQSAKSVALRTLAELEKDYGPFLHNSLFIYNLPDGGGMEYCGGTMSSTWALPHEIFHSYFARGVMPSGGNSGWIDESIASWRDKGYPNVKVLNSASSMGARNNYVRWTDQDAYTFGPQFMGYLNNKMLPQGGLKVFLKNMVMNHKYQHYNSELLRSWMEDFFKISFLQDFKTYIYAPVNNVSYDWKQRFRRLAKPYQPMRPSDRSPEAERIPLKNLVRYL